MDPTYYVLIIATATVGGWFTPSEELVHLPGYSRVECEQLAAAVPPPKAARCEPEPPSRMPVICPFGSPCWQARSPRDVMRPVP